VLPDIVTLGKELGAGYPISATVARKHASCFEFGDQGSTFNGSPLSTAVANAVVNTIATDECLANVVATDRYFQQQLQQLAKGWGHAIVRGRGLLWAIDLGCDRANEIRDAALESGLIVNAARPSVLRMSPSLRVTKSEIDEAMECLDRCMTDVLAVAS
jgi:acetylornithine/N-succinyldiaminopimelate aminotransferase